MQFNKVLLATFVAAAAASAHANVVGNSSNLEKIKVGAVGTDINHTGDVVGAPAIAVINNGVNAAPVTNKFVDLSSLRGMADKWYSKMTTNLGGLDSSGIVQLDFNKWNLPKPVPDHSVLGKFSYQQIQLDPNNASQSVFFGEWHQGSTTSAADNTRTVFYVGSTDNLSLPTSGTATYQVTGINQYNGAVNSVISGWTGNGTTAAPQDVLTGTLVADFGAKSLTTESALTRAVAKQGAANTILIAAKIANNGGFTGTAVANGSVIGKTDGSFFGPNAAALAGNATFAGNQQLNTAFGGQKAQ
ncbi:hypothetical protein BFG52_04895 [Acinetobacter larvae]|uniref:Uncharacterized protein n=2 Tax=Acinetobacter larvae TaxID=1789224 RepID=A0A1B2LY02_9GAMM|nr:hypothetical protein BFG52_04895 [Acinetobacter larvae]